MVVKVDDLDLQRRWAWSGASRVARIAWKFPPMTATTMLERVMWNVGRTGHMVPFASLEPVQVSGVTVKLPPCTTRRTSRARTCARATR